MKKLLVIQMLLTVFIHWTFAQDIPGIMSKFCPASPQAQSLMRYIDVPVDLSTGIPNINIPIYTLKANNIEIPISISYHASGNKVQDIASEVGLGWTLNAGGRIVQNVENNPDSYPIKFSFSSVSEAESLLAEQESVDNYDTNWLSYTSNYRYVNTGDIASDRYFYSFNENSGVFRFNIKTNKVETIPKTPLKIIKSSETSFEIVDTNGTIYKFKRYGGFTVVSGFSGGTMEYCLTKIAFPGIKDTVEFEYVLSEEYSISNRPETVRNGIQYDFTWTQQTSGYPYLILVASPYYHNDRASATQDKVNMVSPLLTKIKWKNSSIIFNYTTDRLDCMKERLVNIEIKDTNSLEEINFDNDEYLGNNESNYRMLLSSVKINDKTYSFKYNRTALPNYESITKYYDDFWGYYNGEHDYSIPFEWTAGSISGSNVTFSQRSYISIREPDTLLTQAGIIESIAYPTGGHTVFSFEQNRGKNVYQGIEGKTESINYFGGLRVNKITNYIGDTIVGEKYYEYEDGSTVTSITPSHFCKTNTVFFVPTVVNPQGSGLYNPEDILTDQNEFASSGMPNYPINNYGSIGYYKKVTELNNKSGVNSGKTIYIYSSPDYHPARTISRYDMGNQKPVLLKKLYYSFENNKFKLVKKEDYTYETIDQDKFLYGIKVSEGEYVSTDPSPILPTMKPVSYYLYALKIKGFSYFSNFDIEEGIANKSYRLLKKKTTKLYCNNDSIESNVLYNYDPSYRVSSPIEIKTTNSDGVVEVNKYLYPFECATQSNVYKNMVVNNMLSPIIELCTSKNNEIINSVLTTYKESSSNFVPDKIYSLVTSTPLSSFTAFNGTTKDSHYNAAPKVIYNSYDAYGNPTQITTEDGIVTSYLWAYNKEYLVAKIESSSSTSISVSVDDISLSKSDNLADIRNDVVYLQSLLSTYISDDNYQVTLYTYKPLVGMTSSTAPNGVTTYYEYDDFGRLKNVRNDDGKITSRSFYHYYNETTADGPTLSLNKTSMSFTSSAGSSTFTISSNCTWSVSDNASWLTVSPGSGSGNGTITVTASANSSSARSATITIIYSGNQTKTISVSQSKYSYSLTVSPTTLTFPYVSRTQTIAISSNTTWTISRSVTWLTVSSSSGTGDATISVTCEKNTSVTKSRSGTLTITGGGITITVSVTQTGGA